MAELERTPPPQANALVRAWRNFSTGGRPDDITSPLIRKVKFLNFYLFATCFVCAVFVPVNLYHKMYVTGYSELVLSVAGLGVLLFLRWTERIELAQVITLVYAISLMVVLLATGGIEKTGIFWWYCIPPGAFFLMGRRRGWWWVVATLAILGVYCLVVGLGRVEGPYTLIQIRQFSISYVVISVIMYFYASVRDDWQELVEHKTAEVLDTNTRLTVEVAEREKAQEALEAAKREAERANAAKSEFLSRMSHELRTPMNSILGFSQLMEMDTKEPLTPSQRENVEQILSSGHHLLMLINEVLDLARIEAGRVPLTLEAVEVHPMVAECLAAVKPLADQRGVFLRDETGAFVGLKVTADGGRLRQVLLNLLSNAIKYNKPDGLVTVEAAPVEAGSIRLSVTDSGVGIAGDKQSLVFEPFQRLAAENTGVEGTGIGLTIVKKLVDMMGGAIGMKSEPGLGSCFWVDLPMAGEAVPVPLPVAPMPLAAAKERGASAGRILYIEDDPTNLTLVRHVLGKRPGTELLLAMRGEEGLDLARANRPDLILLDVHLPDMDGDEVYRRLTESPETNEIPVVVVSASAMPSDLERLRAMGVDGYLTKPLDVRLFLDTVDDYLERARKARGEESQGGPA